MRFSKRAWLSLAMIGLGSIAGCPSQGTPICPDCKLTANGDCGSYRLLMKVESDGGQLKELTSPVLVIEYRDSNGDQIATKTLQPSPFQEGQEYTTDIVKADFPALCANGDSLWDTAEPSLKIVHGSEDVAFDLTIE